MATHVILISAAAPGKFNVQLDGDTRFIAESTPMPYLESAQALLSAGLALPSDMLVMKFGGSSYEIRKGRIQDAVRRAGQGRIHGRWRRSNEDHK
jgi:hypothetical protein